MEVWNTEYYSVHLHSPEEGARSSLAHSGDLQFVSQVPAILRAPYLPDYRILYLICTP